MATAKKTVKAAHGSDNYLRETILAHMRKNELSQMEVCRRTGLAQSHMNRWARGDRDMTGRTLGRIMEAVGLKLAATK